MDHGNKLLELWVLRHGRTVWNQKRLTQGQDDTPLLRSSLEETAELARILRASDVKFDHAVSSDLRRSSRTCEIVLQANERGAQVVELDPRLRERHMGEVQGKPYGTFQRMYPEEVEVMEDVAQEMLSGGVEGMGPFSRRIMEALHEIALACDRKGHKRILVGTHSGAIRAIQMKLYDIKYDQSVSSKNSNILVLRYHPTRITGGDSKFMIMSVNNGYGLLQSEKEPAGGARGRKPSRTTTFLRAGLFLGGALFGFALSKILNASRGARTITPR